jgi:hypothetical protein
MLMHKLSLYLFSAIWFAISGAIAASIGFLLRMHAGPLFEGINVLIILAATISSAVLGIIIGPKLYRISPHKRSYWLAAGYGLIGSLICLLIIDFGILLIVAVYSVMGCSHTSLSFQACYGTPSQILMMIIFTLVTSFLVGGWIAILFGMLFAILFYAMLTRRKIAC